MLTLLMKALRLRLVPTLLAACLASGCATVEVEPFPDPLRPPRPLPATTTGLGEVPSPAEDARAGPRTTRAPGVVIQRTVAEGIADRLGEDLTGDPIRVSFHDVPLVPFINEVFGEELGMSFVISPGLREKTDLVTLKLTEPLPPRQLFATARRVLREYGVDVREVEEGILSFAPSQDIASRDVPLLVSGRTLPEVPATHRTIFQLVPLRVVRTPQVRGWLKEAFERQDLKILEDPDRNALVLKGNADMIARALAMIDVLDQPLLRARHGLIIEPLFMEAGDMANALNTILRAEGYQSTVNVASSASVMLLPLQSANKVVVFARTSPPSTTSRRGRWRWTPAARTRSRRRCSPTRSGTPRPRSWSRPSTRFSARVWARLRRDRSARTARAMPAVKAGSHGGTTGRLGATPNSLGRRDRPVAASSSTGTATCCSSAAPARSGPRSGASSSAWTGPFPRC